MRTWRSGGATVSGPRPHAPEHRTGTQSRHRLGDPNWAGIRSTQLGALAGTWRFQANRGCAVVEPMAARKSYASSAVLLVIGREAADQADGGGAMDPFRLGGACARELSPWVSFGHRILRRGAPGKGKPHGARWVLVCPHSVRPPCSPFGVGLPRSGLSVLERARDSSLSPGSPSRSFAERAVAQQTLTPGPCALLGTVLCLPSRVFVLRPGPLHSQCS